MAVICLKQLTVLDFQKESRFQGCVPEDSLKWGFHCKFEDLVPGRYPLRVRDSQTMQLQGPRKRQATVDVRDTFSCVWYAAIACSGSGSFWGVSL